MTIELDFEEIQLGLSFNGYAKASLSRIEAVYRAALELCDNWVIQAGEYHRQRDALKTALEEHEAVISSMLSEDWPIGRLDARLTRLQTIARQALADLDKEER